MPATPPTKNQRGFLIPIGGAEGKRKKDRQILEKFVGLCGGDDARILVIPTASRLEETGPAYMEIFEQLGARSRSIPVERREDCFGEEILEVLERTTGIFITGGNQLRLSTIYGGTPVAQALRRMNAEGVPLAGTSAGAREKWRHRQSGQALRTGARSRIRPA